MFLDAGAPGPKVTGKFLSEGAFFLFLARGRSPSDGSGGTVVYVGDVAEVFSKNPSLGRCPHRTSALNRLGTLV